MKKMPLRSYIMIFACLLFLASLSTLQADRIRGSVMSALNQVWHVVSFPKRLFGKGKAKDSYAVIAQYEVENLLLRERLEHLERTLEQKEELGEKYVHPVRVIARDPSAWSSSLWIDAGAGEVSKDSPVVLGTALVGVVDYVGKSQSRVRLITDPGLIPSVRAHRGLPQMQRLQRHVSALEQAVGAGSTLFVSPEEANILQENLKVIRKRMLQQGTAYLAKGELRGAKGGAWCRLNGLLEGTGFNYDFADALGPARELDSGRPLDGSDSEALPLIAAGDLLVTTGMDGVFPAGLQVAVVEEVLPLREGCYYFDITARPIAADMDQLKTLLVLPPTGYTASDKPPYGTR